MIPKKIHYCWFGRGEKPELAKKCIASWKKFLPDYEIIEWNEDNFDVNIIPYTSEAYSAKKYAFVSDYARLYVLYTYGGIYMDTDVEVLRSYDNFLNNTAFSGFESDRNIPTGMMASIKGTNILKELLEQYLERKFILDNGKLDLTTNTIVITKYMLSKGLILNNKYQELDNQFAFYPSDYFCPKDHTTGKIKITKNSVCIHHFAGSWIHPNLFQKLRHKLKVKVERILGSKITSILSNIITLRIIKK